MLVKILAIVSIVLQLAGCAASWSVEVRTPIEDPGRGEVVASITGK